MKRAILLIAYGSGSARGKAGICEFENMCRKRFTDTTLRWAYTSVLLRERMVRDGQKSDSVRKALLKLHFEQFTHVAVQPLQSICGREYENARQTIIDTADETGMDCAVGMPLLADNSSCEHVADALLACLPPRRKAGEDVVFMGHGARHASMTMYESLNMAMMSRDANVHIGTMNGAGLDAILPRLTSAKVWLMPLLSVIGQHALRDMAGDGPDSWKSRLCKAGHECQAIIRGLAEYPAVSRIWLDNLQLAWNSLGAQR